PLLEARAAAAEVVRPARAEANVEARSLGGVGRRLVLRRIGLERGRRGRRRRRLRRRLRGWAGLGCSARVAGGRGGAGVLRVVCNRRLPDEQRQGRGRRYEGCRQEANLVGELRHRLLLKNLSQTSPRWTSNALAAVRMLRVLHALVFEWRKCNKGRRF